MIVLVLIALGWWLAAPDRFTAAARTATGQAARAAGSAARGQWVADRGGRQAVRTDRRDRWQRRGENTTGRRFRAWLWRRTLGTERALVAAGRASLSGGRLARAAVSPVPAQARDGWRKGQDRHRARTAGRPVPVALDPPWWRKPVPAETGQDSPQDSGTSSEDSPGPVPTLTTIPGNRRYEPDPYKTVLTRQPNGNIRAEVFYTGSSEHGEQSIWDDEFLSPEAAQRGAEDLIQEVQARHGKNAPATVSWVDRTVTAVPPESLYGANSSDDSLPKGSPVATWRHIPFECVDDHETQPAAKTPFFPDAPDGPVLDDEADIRGRNPELAMIQSGPLTEGQRRFWHLRDRGYPGALDQDGWPAPDSHTGAIVNPMPYLHRQPGTTPDAAPTPAPSTEGDSPVSINVPAEIGDLITLHQFADAVIADAEENGPGSAYSQACASLREYFSRDFGQQVDASVGGFEEAAAALTAAWTQLVEAAQGVKQEALTSIGG